LRAIADAAEKYQVPTVKVTGGQRIDLLGVKKGDLPAVWKDIGMPSGHAYAKALRTVKTCVGSEWCRFGTQDSTQMGKDLERTLWRMYAPHKVKLAVSGCPRNCAEAGIKDVGVIGVDSGWEIHVGGNGGIKTEVAQFFCKVRTPEEVLEHAGAFLQLYREEGWYLERTCHYLARVGLDHAKKAVLDDAGHGKKIRGFPAAPMIWTLRFLERLKLSPLYKWVYETASKDSFVSIDKAERVLGFTPRFSNKDALVRNYRWYVEHLDQFRNASGVSHRVPWKQGILSLAKHLF